MQSVKKKKQKNKKVWDLFEKAVPEAKKIECLYTKSNQKIRDKCDLCKSPVRTSVEKFLVCTNEKCGIIYKEVLDHTAEWRYYGAGDSKNSDPTRCGMPIDPLLKISSYVCKVLCGRRSTYEMRKIRRYTEWQ